MADGMAIGAVDSVTAKKKQNFATGEGFDVAAFLKQMSVFEAAQLLPKPQETTGATAMYG